MKKSTLAIVLTASLGVGVLMGAVKSKLKGPPKVAAVENSDAVKAPKKEDNWCPRLVRAVDSAHSRFKEGHNEDYIMFFISDTVKEFNPQVVFETGRYAYQQGWDHIQLEKHVENNCARFGKPVRR